MWILGSWSRRLFVSGATAVVVYFTSLAVMIWLAYEYRTWNPRLEYMAGLDTAFKSWLAVRAKGNHVFEIAVNAFHTHFNLIHILVTLIVLLLVGIPFGFLLNWVLKGTRTMWERVKISLLSVLLGILFALVLFTLNIWSPSSYAWLIWLSHGMWEIARQMLKWFDHLTPVGFFLSLTYQRPFGHSIVFMALGNMLAMLLLNAWYAMKANRRVRKAARERPSLSARLKSRERA